MNTVVIDAGPLIALLSQREKHHKWTVENLQSHSEPLETCEAVLSAACFILRRSGKSAGAVIEMVERGVIAVPFRLDTEAAAIRHLMAQYAKVPMSLADACLVRMTELNDRATILTFDHDFRVYRRNGRHVIPLLMPPKA